MKHPSAKMPALSQTDGSRPTSEAPSDLSFATTTDSPGSPRAIAREIDHIKALISRSEVAPHPVDGTITAQVFRPKRSSSHEPVTEARIFHDLDKLKKRIRHRRRQSVELQLDSDLDTESDDNGPLDGRVEELQRVRQELVDVKQQREEWIGDAEGRIDGLMAEREDLKEQLRQIASSSMASSADAEGTEKLRSSNLELQVTIDYLREEKTELGQKAEGLRNNLQRVQERVERLESDKQQVDNLLRESQEKVAGLEENGRVAGEHLQRKLVHHTTQMQESQKLLSELQMRFNNSEEASKQSRSRIEELERDAKDLAVCRSQLMGELDEHKNLLETARKEFDVHEKEIRELMESHGKYKAQVDQLSHERDQYKTDLERVTQERDSQASAREDKTIKLETNDGNDLSLSDGHSRMISELEGRVDQIKRDHQAEVEQIHEQQERDIENFRFEQSAGDQSPEIENLRGRLAKLAAEQKMVLTEREAELGSKLSALRYEHSKALSEAQERGQRALEDERQFSQSQIATLKHNHEVQLAEMRTDTRTEADARIARLEQQHETAMAAALAMADDDCDCRLRAQARAHGEEIEQIHESLNTELANLQAQLEEASDVRHTQMKAADAESKDLMAELDEKLRTTEQASAELASKQITAIEELSALQARLEAESTGRAEAERALAIMRKQKFQEDLSPREVSGNVVGRLPSQEADLDGSDSMVAGVGAGQDAKTPGVQPRAGQASPTDALLGMQSRLESLEAERDAAARSASELARQNEFLAKELEATMARLSSPVDERPPPTLIDSAVQTEAFIGDATPRRRDTPALSEESRVSSWKLRRLHRSDSRPETPTTPSRRRTQGSPGSRASSSFEEYLKGARAEFSELRGAITANEALFTQKIEEHFGSLQAEKDRLASEYDEKFRDLLDEKEKMELHVSSKSAAEFAKEHQELAQQHGANQSPRAVGSEVKKAFHRTEGRLVGEYNKRMAKRKSQVALQHAEQLHTLARDYDREMGKLVNDKEGLERDLAVDPSKFEQDFHDLAKKSAVLETEKASSLQRSPHVKSPSQGTADSPVVSPVEASTKAERRRSQLPTRSVSSTPRTARSIPRAAAFPGSRHGPDATSQPLQARLTSEAPTTSLGRHPPLAQHSLLRGKPPGEPGAQPRRTVTTPDGKTGMSASALVQVDEAHNVGVDPARVAKEMQMAEEAWRAQHTGKAATVTRPLRHSVGIYFPRHRAEA